MSGNPPPEVVPLPRTVQGGSLCYTRSMKRQNRASEYTLPPDQVAALIHATPAYSRRQPIGHEFRDRALLEVLAWLALRRSEAAALDWRDLDLVRGIATIHGKGGKVRSLRFGRLYPQLVSDLRHLQGSRTAGSVFSVSPRRVAQIVQAKAEAGGIVSPNPNRSTIGPHLLRHTWARHALDNGVDVRVVQQWLGHAHYSTTVDVYGTPSEEYSERELIDKLGEL